jgi:hypothetical protein
MVGVFCGGDRDRVEVASSFPFYFGSIYVETRTM